MSNPSPSTTPSPPPTWPVSAERDDSLTAAEAELAGPWKIEPVPGRPGAVAILRIWEDLAVDDPPVGVLWHLETARLFSVLLPAIDREPLFYLEEEPAAEGFPLVAVYGEQGPQVAGWLDRYEPRWAEGLAGATGSGAGRTCEKEEPQKWTYPTLVAYCQRKKITCPALGPQGEILGESPRS